jgi:hypothetical protein
MPEKLTIPPFKRLSEMDVEQPIAVLDYGGSGVGKTVFCGTAGDRACIIDCGLGPIEVLKSPWFQKKYGFDPIIVQVRERMKKNDQGKLLPAGEAFDLLSDTVTYALEELGDQIDTLAIDNATAVRHFQIPKTLQISADARGSKTKLKSEEWGFPFLERTDYNVLIDMTEWYLASFIESCKAHGKNFILTAHQRVEYIQAKDSKGKPTMERQLHKIRPGFSGQTFPDDVPALFDEVWYHERVSEGVHRVHLLGDDVITAKTTYGAGVFVNERGHQLAVWPDPHFKNMLFLIREAWKKAQPKLVKEG